MKPFLTLLIPITFFACQTKQAEVVKTDTLTFRAPSPTTIKQGKATTDTVKSKHVAKKSVKKFGLTSSGNTTLSSSNGTIFFDGTGKLYDTIKVQAGTYSGGVTFVNVNGTATKPTVIINVGGQVIGSNGSDAGLDLSTCRYVHFTGTGVASIKYGFVGSGGGTASFDAHYGTSDVEVDHIECYGSLYAGLVYRTYPSTGCQWSVTGGNGPASQAQMNSPVWAIYNMIIHDNYVHDVPGEGMYLGQSHYGNADAFSYTPAGGNPLGGCSSGNESPIIGAKVYNNIVKNVGADGIQLSGCISGCSVNYNTIIGFATGGGDGQDGGITWNPGSVGSIDHNWIEYTGNSVCMGIMYQGQGDTYITNNVIIGHGNGQVGLALLRNTQPNVIGSAHAKIFIADNTVTGFQTGYWWYGDNGFGSNVFFSNNIINAPTVYSIGNGNISTLQKTTNIETSSFTFTGANDFHLPAGSPAIGKGTQVSYVTDDYDKKLRPNPPSVGAYEGGSGGGGGTTNIPPVAKIASVTNITLPTNSVTLDGTGSTDADGTISSYTWSGAGGTITNPSASKTTVTGLPAGSYTYILAVTDNAGATNSASVSFTVNPAGGGGGTYVPPAVVTLGDQVLASGANTCNISGTITKGSYPVTKVLWTQVSGPNTAFFSSAGTITTAVGGLTNGAYVFKVTVTDSSGVTAFAQETVTASGIVVTPPPVKTIVALSYSRNTNNSVTVKYSDGTQGTKTIRGISWTTTAGSGVMTFTDGTTLKLN